MKLQVEQLVDHTAGWAVAPADNFLTTPSDLTITFVYGGVDRISAVGGRILIIASSAVQRDLHSDGIIGAQFPFDLTRTQLSAAISDCRTVWWENIIEYKDGIDFVFHRATINNDRKNDFVDGPLAKIAYAGRLLFNQIFVPVGRGYESTQALGKWLRRYLASKKELRIVMRGDDFVVPWSLLYLGDLFRPTNPELFLGVRHIIEQEILRSICSVGCEVPTPSRIALHLDQDVDTNSMTRPFRAIANFREFLQDYQLEEVVRETKFVFLKALSDGTDESVFYFLCHGEYGSDKEVAMSQARFSLTSASSTKREYITPPEIKACVSETGSLRSHPLIFLNACRAGRQDGLFYSGFADAFLKLGAIGFVGPEIEMPVVFARDFARAFFEELFKGGPKNSIGHVMLRLRKEYLINQKNPLAMAFSVYGGTASYFGGMIPKN